MSSMSKDSVTKAAQSIPAIKILPAQISKLKKEEDEETWISGEELYTEGSSDEENCRCKSRSTDISKESSLSLVARPHRLKGKSDKKPRAAHSRSSSARENDSMLKSASKSNVYTDEDDDEEEEYVADVEISWKANRDDLQLEDEMMVLQEYPKICDSMDDIFRDLIGKLDHLETVETANYSKQRENFESTLKSNTAFFDAAISKLQSEIERVRKNTRRVQFTNRLRLNKIINGGGPKLKILQENDKKFIDLYDPKEWSDVKDVTNENVRESDTSETMQLSDITEDREQLLDESVTIAEVDISNLDSVSISSNN